MNKTYEEWAWSVTTAGIACGLYHPIEALANILLHSNQLGQEINKEYVEKYMKEVTENILLGDNVTLYQATKYFNDFYPDNRMDFGVYANVPF